MKRNFFLISILIIISFSINYSQSFYAENFAHTYSIVARDTKTGEMGVAVQSHWFSVGSLVTWAEAGVGAIATQSFVNPSFGPNGLELLKSGKTAQQVLDKLIADDEGRDVRQLAIIDSKGNVATHTGKKCIDDAGHIIGDNYSVQANMMLNDKVWPAMSKAFENSTGPLAERLVEALEAAQNAGGDIRGKQSAAIVVVKGETTGKVWEDRIVDLRVEDHTEPIKEIKRLLKIQRAYEHMNAGDLAIENSDIDGALREYGAAQSMFPENLEMKYWHAVSLVNIGKLDDSLPIFKEIFKSDKNWLLLTKRLPKVGLLDVNNKEMKKIIKLAE